MRPTIALITDFGTVDGYVGTMHGVILGINADATIVDLSHAIQSQSVRQAAYVLYAAYPFFPVGTVFVVVVDPGVGTERRAIAVQTDRAILVAPDNGVLSYVLASEQTRRAIELTKREYWLPTLSATFHGRDVFAPAAAHLSLGVPIDALGRPADQLVSLPIPHPTLRAPGHIEGHVLHIDRFGNVITDVKEDMLRSRSDWRVGLSEGISVAVRRTYASVARGSPVALIGSRGHLEIAVRDGSAADVLGLRIGDAITVTSSQSAGTGTES